MRASLHFNHEVPPNIYGCENGFEKSEPGKCVGPGIHDEDQWTGEASLGYPGEHERSLPWVDRPRRVWVQQLPRADAPVQDLIDMGRGVYNISSVTPSLKLPDDLQILSADPGQAKVINVTEAPQEVWSTRDPVLLLPRSSHVSGEDYRSQIMARRSDPHEASRRGDTPYWRSVEGLGSHKKRTSCLQTFLAYCRSWFHHGSALLEETLGRTRRIHRFSRFRATQSMGTLEDKSEVMLFGKASFRPQKGRASAPRKAMTRKMASRGVVLMVNEHNTSKLCPGCFTKCPRIENGESGIAQTFRSEIRANPADFIQTHQSSRWTVTMLVR